MRVRKRTRTHGPDEGAGEQQGGRARTQGEDRPSSADGRRRRSRQGRSGGDQGGEDDHGGAKRARGRGDDDGAGTRTPDGAEDDGRRATRDRSQGGGSKGGQPKGGQSKGGQAKGGQGKGGQGKGGGKRRRSRSSQRRGDGQRPKQPKDGRQFWGEAARLPSPRTDVRISSDPDAVPRSLGPPPLPGHEQIAAHYFGVVYDRAVTTASALAAAGGLIDPDALTGEDDEA